MNEKTTRATGLTPAKMAELLKKAGARHVTESSVRADIEAGAPTAEDGTMSLVEYAAWLTRESRNAD